MIHVKLLITEGEPTLTPCLIGSRKRRSSAAESVSEKVRRSESVKKHKDHKGKKRKQKDSQWSVSVTEIDTEAAPEEVKEVKDEGEEEEEEEDAARRSPSPSDERQPASSKRSPIAAFLPPQHSLWTWADPGWRASAKSRRLFHSTIRRQGGGGGGGGDTLSVGDCAVFLSTSRPDRPYIGRIHSLWQTGGGNMKVQVGVNNHFDIIYF